MLDIVTLTLALSRWERGNVIQSYLQFRRHLTVHGSRHEYRIGNSSFEGMSELNHRDYMQDYFALLNQPRSPELNLNTLKESFTKLTAEVHPDRFHNTSVIEQRVAHQKFTELNSAYQCLRDTKLRLQHLFELETGKKPANVQEVPQQLVDMFFSVSNNCREADQFIARKEKATSALVRAQMMEDGVKVHELLVTTQSKLQPVVDKIQSNIESLAAVWTSSVTGEKRGSALARLEQIYREWAFVSRWQGQIQERVFKVSL